MEDAIVDDSSGHSACRPGRLVTFLGTAPGVGKTYRMLAEAARRAGAGEEVVIGWLERHERLVNSDLAFAFAVVPPRSVSYRGSAFEEFDVAGVLARQPDVVVVDELAHTSVDGRKRHDEVGGLLAGGIDVLTTVNVANLISAPAPLACW